MQLLIQKKVVMQRSFMAGYGTKAFGQRKLFVPLFYLYLSQIGDDIATNVVCKITMNWFSSSYRLSACPEAWK
jgi:hypothetical protein